VCTGEEPLLRIEFQLTLNIRPTFSDFQNTFSEEKEPEAKGDFEKKLKDDLDTDKQLGPFS